MKPTIRLLYAEDNAQDADLTRSHFAEYAPEFELQIVTTGTACLEQIEISPPDLVMLDHRLPDADGIEMLTTLRRKAPGLPVVMVTGVGNEGLVVRALRLGAVNYVAKHGNYLESLPDLLRDALEEYRVQPSSGPRTTVVPLQILYVEHLPMDIDLTLQHFTEVAPHFAVDVVHTCAEAMARLAQSRAYDLALINLRMPDQSGLDFVREAKRRRLPLPPFIMISGAGDEETAVATLKLRAVDYIVKREGYLDELTFRIDRSRAQLAISNLLARHRAIIDSSMDAIISIDADERIVMFSAAAERLFLLSADKAIGQPIERFIPQRYHQAHHGHIAGFINSHVTVRTMRQFGRINALRSDGTEFPIEAAIAQSMIGDRTILTVTLRDISVREQAAAAHAELEAQLRESQKMEAIGTLAGGIAHDFNNILAAILGNTHLAREYSAGNTAVQVSLTEIHKAAIRARDLVQQILSFSRRQPTERKVIALTTVVSETEHFLRATLPARLALRVHCAADAPAVLADATQMQQVLINLATNAMQAMHERTGHIDIDLDTVTLDAALVAAHPHLHAMFASHPGKAVRLSVSDDGSGMDADTVTRIFEPFFTTKQAGEGTGLGLSVVHGIVQVHEGAILVKSAPGTGTTFALYLPVVAEAAAAPISNDAGGATANVPAAGRDSVKHILYLDDEEDLVFLMRRLLELGGYRVSGFIKQDEALAALRADPTTFDLLITDYNMPGMSGLDVAREARSIRADLPVAIASGFLDETLRQTAAAAGVRALIFKATAIHEFVAAVQAAAGGAKTS